MRRAAAILLVAGALLAPAGRAANAIASDISDIWCIEGESGWGMNATLQASALFVTLYAYSADGKAHWFVAPQRLSPPRHPD